MGGVSVLIDPPAVSHNPRFTTLSPHGRGRTPDTLLLRLTDHMNASPFV